MAQGAVGFTKDVLVRENLPGEVLPFYATGDGDDRCVTKNVVLIH